MIYGYRRPYRKAAPSLKLYVLKLQNRVFMIYLLQSHLKGDNMNFEYQASVIVPVYNVEQYLRICLDSLVNQTIDKSKWRFS